MSYLWASRQKSEALLDTSLVAEREALDDLFKLCDDVLARLHEHDSESECRLAWITLLKARRLALGIYSMILDCLGQEAGALFRLLQETWEFLTYLELDPARAESVVTSGKPSAGEIAKAIEGRFKHLREFLNVHASHLSLSYEAVGHTIDMERMGPRLEYSPTPRSIRKNMAPLFAFLFFSVGEAAKILQRHDPSALKLFEDRLETLRTEGYGLFRQNS